MKRLLSFALLPVLALPAAAEGNPGYRGTWRPGGMGCFTPDEFLTRYVGRMAMSEGRRCRVLAAAGAAPAWRLTLICRDVEVPGPRYLMTEWLRVGEMGYRLDIRRRDSRDGNWSEEAVFWCRGENDPEPPPRY